MIKTDRRNENKQGGHAEVRLFVGPLPEAITLLLVGRSSETRWIRKAKNIAHILAEYFEDTPTQGGVTAPQS